MLTKLLTLSSIPMMLLVTVACDVEVTDSNADANFEGSVLEGSDDDELALESIADLAVQDDSGEGSDLPELPDEYIDAQAPSSLEGAFVGGASDPLYASCSGFGCDGKDPVSSGCDSGAQTLGPPIKIDLWVYNAYVEQRYSPTCKTRWTRIYRTNSKWSMDSSVTLRRIINGSISGETYPKSGWYSGALNYTDMLYCPRYTCTAESRGSVSGYGSGKTAWIE